MYGWRGLVSFLTPTYRGRTVKALFELMPEGVGLIPAPLGISRGSGDVFSASFDKAEEAAKTLALWGVDVMTQPGIPPWLVKGPAFEREWISRIEAQTHVPFISPLQAGVEAMQHMDIRKVLLITYFGEELNSQFKEYMRPHSIDVVEAPWYRMSDETEDLYNTPLIALSKIGPGEVYRFVRQQAARADAFDGVFIIGGGWEAWEAIQPLEYDLRKPVIYALTANLWSCLERIGVHEPIPGQGALLEGRTR